MTVWSYSEREHIDNVNMVVIITAGDRHESWIFCLCLQCLFAVLRPSTPRAAEQDYYFYTSIHTPQILRYRRLI